MNNFRSFWCELFGTHDWFRQESFYKDGLFWEVLVCKKCGKIKIEPAPIVELPHIEAVRYD